MALQALPSYCITPPDPTAKTFEDELPQTPLRSSVAPLLLGLGMALQAETDEAVGAAVGVGVVVGVAIEAIVGAGVGVGVGADVSVGVGVDVGAGADVNVGVAVGVAVTDTVLLHELPDISKVSNSATTSALHRNFLILFSSILIGQGWQYSTTKFRPVDPRPFGFIPTKTR